MIKKIKNNYTGAFNLATIKTLQSSMLNALRIAIKQQNPY